MTISRQQGAILTPNGVIMSLGKSLESPQTVVKSKKFVSFFLEQAEVMLEHFDILIRCFAMKRCNRKDLNRIR